MWYYFSLICCQIYGIFIINQQSLQSDPETLYEMRVLLDMFIKTTLK